MIKEKLLRDPIHDLIAFDLNSREDRLLLAAMDSFEVQRLRRIKQLGMAHMAFQGAEHSRFTHSIGVMHLTRRLIERLQGDAKLDPEAKLATMAAALLHDVGHGPFSHVMEKFFRERHEAWTRRILLSPDTEVHQVLRGYSTQLPDLVVAALDGDIKPGWLHKIISSQLDADRFDYLLRDSHMTGVKYGIFDLTRLLLLLRTSSDGEDIVIAAKGLLPVEKYVQSRYQMYRQVYFHKTVTSAEAMLMSLLQRGRDLALEAGEVPCLDKSGPLFRLLAEEDLDIPDFLAMDDSVLLGAMNNWSRCPEPVLRDLSMRLLNRRLFKSLEVETQRRDEEDFLFGERSRRAKDLLTERGLDWRYYLRFSESKDTPYRPYTPRDTPIWIEKQGDPSVLVDVKDVSPTLKAFVEGAYTIHRVFFPAEAHGAQIRKDMEAIWRG